MIKLQFLVVILMIVSMVVGVIEKDNVKLKPKDYDRIKRQHILTEGGPQRREYMIVKRIPINRYSDARNTFKTRVLPYKVVQEGNTKHVYIKMPDIFEDVFRKKPKNPYTDFSAVKHTNVPQFFKHYQQDNLKQGIFNQDQFKFNQNYANFNQEDNKYNTGPSTFDHVNQGEYKFSQDGPAVNHNSESLTFNQSGDKFNSEATIFNQNGHNFNQEAPLFNQDDHKFNQDSIFNQNDHKFNQGPVFNQNDHKFSSEAVPFNQDSVKFNPELNHQALQSFSQEYPVSDSAQGEYRTGKSGFKPIYPEYAPQFRNEYNNIKSYEGDKFIPSTPIDANQVPDEYKDLFSKFSTQYGVESSMGEGYYDQKFEPSQKFEQLPQPQKITKYDPKLANMVHNVLNKGQGSPMADGFKIVKSNDDNSMYLVGQPGMPLNVMPDLSSISYPNDFKQSRNNNFKLN